jgi:hypothetical protein
MVAMPSIHPIIYLLLLCLSPYGPAELQEGASWTYAVHESSMPKTVSLRIVGVSPEEDGLLVSAEVGMGSETEELRVRLSPDRRTLHMRAGEETATLHVPEFAPGVTWKIPGADALTVTAVEALPLSVPAGKFPEALKVSLGSGGVTEGVIWLAPGVGFLVAEEDGVRAMELTEYHLGRAATSRHPPAAGGRGGQRPRPQHTATPAVTALDENTFVVTDPVTKTVTVFRVVRSDTGEWKLERKARARYARPRRAAAEQPAAAGK